VGFMHEPTKGYGRAICLVISLMVATVVWPAAGDANAVPTATPPYSITTFASNPTGLSKPDSITFNATSVFVGYGNGGHADGSGGAMSNIVEYDMTGKQLNNTVVVGHNDGLRIDPATGDLWAIQNEDANPTLIIIDLKNGKQTTFNLGIGPNGGGTGPHGGGYDDVIFGDGSVFFSASAPTLTPDTAPAIVSVKVKGKKVTLTGVMNGNADATDVTDGDQGMLNLTDPDSMTFDPNGEIVMTSQGDGELIIVRHPGLSCQKNFVVPLTSTMGPVVGDTQADDTAFATQTAGRMLVADKSLGMVFSITAPYFPPGAAYSAIDVFSDPSGTTQIGAFVGQTNLATGFVTPIINNMGNPGGMAFIPTEGDTDKGKAAQPVQDEEALECP
jgi:hypothetical protein